MRRRHRQDPRPGRPQIMMTKREAVGRGTSETILAGYIHVPEHLVFRHRPKHFASRNVVRRWSEPFRRP
jgi:hypothetical protein